MPCVHATASGGTSNACVDLAVTSASGGAAEHAIAPTTVPMTSNAISNFMVNLFL
jgi:hypothetical protein